MHEWRKCIKKGLISEEIFGNNLQAVWEARTTGSSYPGNFFLPTEWKQPILLKGREERAPLDKCPSFTTIYHQNHLNFANYKSKDQHATLQVEISKAKYTNSETV